MSQKHPYPFNPAVHAIFPKCIYIVSCTDVQVLIKHTQKFSCKLHTNLATGSQNVCRMNRTWPAALDFFILFAYMQKVIL